MQPQNCVTEADYSNTISVLNKEVQNVYIYQYGEKSHTYTRLSNIGACVNANKQNIFILINITHIKEFWYIHGIVKNVWVMKQKITLQLQVLVKTLEILKERGKSGFPVPPTRRNPSCSTVADSSLSHAWEIIIIFLNPNIRIRGFLY